jgi:hypothetical protein
VLCTGDNTDNHKKIELDWFLTVLNGGTITPDTGDPARFEGVQNSPSTLYWNPGDSTADMYKAKGFPQTPDLLANAIKPFTSRGLNRPWYSVFGNHDDGVQGTFPSGIPLVDAIYTGSFKIEGAYYDSRGNLVRGSASDTLFVLFSHHTSGSMDNLLPDPTNILEPGHDGAALVALLNRFPNVVAWVNGHTHRNEIIAHPGATQVQGFWEINTASHTDFPQQARIIEPTDNGDGTLSLFTTLIEAESPYATDFGNGSATGLASLYREIAANDLHASPGRIGAPVDHNTELMVVKPF